MAEVLGASEQAAWADDRDEHRRFLFGGEIELGPPVPLSPEFGPIASLAELASGTELKGK